MLPRILLRKPLRLIHSSMRPRVTSQHTPDSPQCSTDHTVAGHRLTCVCGAGGKISAVSVRKYPSPHPTVIRRDASLVQGNNADRKSLRKLHYCGVHNCCPHISQAIHCFLLATFPHYFALLEKKFLIFAYAWCGYPPKIHRGGARGAVQHQFAPKYPHIPCPPWTVSL